MTTSLQTCYKSYSMFLPFGLTLVFQRQGTFNEMIVEAAKKFPQLDLLKCDTINSNVASFVYMPNATGSIFLFCTDELSIDILVHECIHVTMRIFDAIGAEVTEDTEEFFAYLNEMIFRDTIKLLKTKFDFIPKMPFA